MNHDDLVMLLTLKGWQPHGYDKTNSLGLSWVGIFNPSWIEVEWSGVRASLPAIWQYMVDNLGEINVD